MSVKHKLALSILSGLLLAFGWPFIGSATPVLFIALVPLLWIYFSEAHKAKVHFAYSYLTFSIWNFICTYWLYNVEGGFVTKFFSFFMPSLLNALFMAVVWHLALKISRKASLNVRFMTVVSFWIAYEYFHLDWDLSWPWLQLGNALAISHHYFQFYAYTGILGGSLWILLANLVCLKFFMYLRHQKPPRMWLVFRAVASVVFIGLPLLWSFSIDYKPSQNQERVHVVCVQPNVDPYKEKFSRNNFQLQLQEIFKLLAEKAEPTDIFILPETTLQEPSTLNQQGFGLELKGLWENDIQNSVSARVLRGELVQGKNADVLVGMSADSLMPEGLNPGFLDRPIRGTNRYYRAYNAALFQSVSDYGVYNKSKLVPGVEMTPFASVFKHFKGIALDLGGTTGSLGTQDYRTVFKSQRNGLAIAPIICYESIYGDFVGGFVRNGANVLSVITNDAWWGNTAGHKQHFIFSKLRAVEHRRWLARSGNTGISAIINPRGEVVKRSNYDEQTIVQGYVYTETQQTFYSKFGDYLGRLSAFVAALFLLIHFSVRLRSGKIFRAEKT